MSQRVVSLACFASCVLASSSVLSQARAPEGAVVAPGPTEAPAAVDPAQPDPNNPGDQLYFAVQIARKKGRRVLSLIRQEVGDVPTVVGATRTTLPDGTEDLYIVYDVSLFNQCVFEQHPQGRDAMRAARESCVGVRGVETRITHVRVAPTPARAREDSGGAIQFVATADLGTRGEGGRALSHQTFFTGFGAISMSRDSDMRVWVGLVDAEYEMNPDARDIVVRDFVATYESRMLVLNGDLETVSTLDLGYTDDFGRVSQLMAPSFAVPTVEYAAARQRLTVRVGSVSRVYAYNVADDELDGEALSTTDAAATR